MKGISLASLYSQVTSTFKYSPLILFFLGLMLSSSPVITSSPHVITALWYLHAETPRQHQAEERFISMGHLLSCHYLGHGSAILLTSGSTFPPAPPPLHTRPIQATPGTSSFLSLLFCVCPSGFWFTCSSDCNRISYLVAVFVFASLFPVEQTLFFFYHTGFSMCAVWGFFFTGSMFPLHFPVSSCKLH